MEHRVRAKERNRSQTSGYRKIFNTALRILAGRDHSKSELIWKLKQRGFKFDDIDKAVSECSRLDYINDERTGEMYIRQLVRKGFGIKRIRQELAQKGLKGPKIDQILCETCSDDGELKNAEKILKKKFKRFERESDLLKRKEKIHRFLYARGFSREIIIKINENLKSF
jgi:regulatory protein